MKEVRMKRRREVITRLDTMKMLDGLQMNKRLHLRVARSEVKDVTMDHFGPLKRCQERRMLQEKAILTKP